MGLSEEVALAMEGLEAGQRVYHIASFPLRECSADADVQAVLADRDLQDYDYIPVRDGSIVGVLERPHRPATGPVGRYFVPLDDSLIVAAETPLGRFLPMLETRPYRLVVREGKIDGIVTRSDLNKLPVRVHVFARIAHFEMLLGALIARRCPDDDSVLKLVEEGKRKERLRKKLADQQAQRLNPSVIVLMDLTQKWRAASVAYRGEVGPDFAAEMQEIVRLRNAVAHFSPLVPNRQSFRMLYKRLHLLDKWTERLDDLRAQQRAVGASAGQ